MFPDWTWVVGFFIGAAIGSFLNVVIYRTPRCLSIYNPAHSFCPKCRASLGPADLMPLFSWLLSRGKCRHCSAPVSSRYFWVEMVTGAIWAGIWYQYMIVGQDWVRAIAYALAASALIVCIFTDLEFFIIPDQVNAFLVFVGIGLNSYWYFSAMPQAFTWGIPTALAGYLVGMGVLWGITFLGRIAFGKDAMGHGDIKLARGIGAVIGPIPALISFAIAVVLGAVLGIVQVLAFRHPTSVGGNGETSAEVEDEDYEPESIGSILKSGVGYLLSFDIVGLFVPKFYEKWFGEPPFVSVEDEEYPIGSTMIPFGPYLALGAIAAVVFQSQLLGVVDAYLRSFAPS